MFEFHDFDALLEHLEKQKKLNEKYGDAAEARAKKYLADPNGPEALPAHLAQQGEVGWKQFAETLRQIGLQELQQVTIDRLQVTNTGVLIFPPGKGVPRGSCDDLRDGPPNPTPGPKKERLENLAFLNGYRPTWFTGKMGKSHYLVAVLSGKNLDTNETMTIAIAESQRYGQATYVWVSDRDNQWKEVFNQPKQEALDAGAERVYHGMTSWQKKIENLLARHGITERVGLDQ